MNRHATGQVNLKRLLERKPVSEPLEQFPEALSQRRPDLERNTVFHWRLPLTKPQRQHVAKPRKAENPAIPDDFFSGQAFARITDEISVTDIHQLRRFLREIVLDNQRGDTENICLPLILGNRKPAVRHRRAPGQKVAF